MSALNKPSFLSADVFYGQPPNASASWLQSFEFDAHLQLPPLSVHEYMYKSDLVTHVVC